MFSQNQEEKYILEYFGDYVGTFLDLGCNDCQTFSNTRALALRGWRGIFIDPSPKAIDKCRQLYNGHKGFYIYEWAISKHNGKDILRESGPLCSPTDIGLVSTFHINEIKRWVHTKAPDGDWVISFDPVEVTTYKWKTAYNRMKIRTFDFISIDVEGDELNILPDMDLSQTKCLVIEWNSKPELKVEYEKYLEGFKLIYTSAENLIYARV